MPARAGILMKGGTGRVKNAAELAAHKPAQVERRRKVVESMIAGKGYDQTAKDLGISHMTARRDFQIALEELKPPPEMVAAVRDRELESIENSLRVMVATRQKLIATSKLADPAEPLDLKVVQELVRVTDAITRLGERRARMLGSDAPVAIRNEGGPLMVQNVLNVGQIDEALAASRRNEELVSRVEEASPESAQTGNPLLPAPEEREE
jgi:hypothetical protein